MSANNEVNASVLVPLDPASIDYIMEAVQCFASEWSLVGGRFDHGDTLVTFETSEAQRFVKDGDELTAVVTSNQLAASEIQREELQKRIDVLMLENATLKAKLQVQA